MQNDNNRFDVLSNELLLNILKETSPTGVLSLCTTDFRFSDVCRDPYVFKKLLLYHFGNQIKIDLDSLQGEQYREYYRSIVNGETSFYHFNFEEQEEEAQDELVYEKIEEIPRDDQPELFQMDYLIAQFTLNGKVPRGAKTWAVVSTNEINAEWDIFCFKTKNEALRWAHQTSIVKINEFRAYAAREFQNINEDDLFLFAHIDRDYRNFESFKLQIEEGIVLYWYVAVPELPRVIADFTLRLDHITLS